MLTCDPHMSLKKQDYPACSQVLGMQLAMLHHSVDASWCACTLAPHASLTSRVLICWSCHSANATVGTLKSTVSSDDERVAHRGRRVQRWCWSCATLLAPTTHMNSCRWRARRSWASSSIGLVCATSSRQVCPTCQFPYFPGHI